MTLIAFNLLIFILIMTVAFQNQGEFWRKSFSNDDGTPSGSRPLLAFTLIIVASSSITATGLKDIPTTWMTLIFSLLAYAFGKKAIDAFMAVKGVNNASGQDQR